MYSVLTCMSLLFLSRSLDCVWLNRTLGVDIDLSLVPDVVCLNATCCRTLAPLASTGSDISGCNGAVLNKAMFKCGRGTGGEVATAGCWLRDSEVVFCCPCPASKLDIQTETQKITTYKYDPWVLLRSRSMDTGNTSFRLKYVTNTK